jgi:hypothetical protein
VLVTRLVTRLVTIGVIGGLLLVSSAAHAEPTKEEIKRADELFREGRAMMAANKLPEACAKIEESWKLAGGIGTLINLGACHERSGKLALAYGVYNRAAVVAHDAGRFDREKEASERATGLLVLIGRARVVVRSGEDATLQCNGITPPSIEKSVWALDAGPHGCEVRVAGTVRWAGVIKTIAGETQTIEIASSSSTPPGASFPPQQREELRTTPHASPSPNPAPGPAPPPEGASARVVVGWSLVGIGIAGIGVSGLFALQASSKDNDANGHCDKTGCDAQGVALGEEAKSAGNAATAFVIGGAASLAAGLVLVLLLGPSAPASASSSAGRSRVEIRF